MIARSSATRVVRPRQKGWWIPFTFIGAFLVVLAANVTMVVFATSTFSGVQSEHYYLRGLEYNRTIAAVREQAARGWTVDLDFAPTGGKAGRLDLRLEDRHGNWLSDGTVTARLMRPTTTADDFTATLPYVGQGRYASDIAFPHPGQWDIRLDISTPQGDYQLNRRILVDD